MIIGALLPHSKLFGGVKRFFELGNLFVENGHEFVVFNEQGDAPDWFDFKGKIQTISNLGNYRLDVLFFTEPHYYKLVSEANVKQRIFYFVKSGEKLMNIIADGRFRIFTNSTNLYNECARRYGIYPVKAYGGIDTELYHEKSFEPRNPDVPFTIIAFGRLNKKRKGTKTIVKACERVARNHAIKLILFDTPTDQSSLEAIEHFRTSLDHEFILNHPYRRNCELFHKAHVFVSAEQRTGYSNTSAEAMACGIPVVGTPSGTQDFLFHEKTGLVVWRNRFSIARAIKRLIRDEELRLKLAQAGRQEVEKLSWKNLYQNILMEISRSEEKVQVS